MSEARGLRTASIWTPNAELCSAGRTGASVPAWFFGAIRLLFCALREIFDESAYARFLARDGMASSPSAYAAFLREQEAMKARRPKCC
jgi:hypothetical protein